MKNRTTILSLVTIPPSPGQVTNTILAALRYYQSQGMGDPARRPDWLHDIATNGDRDVSLDDAGINEICERVNCGEVNPSAKRAAKLADNS